MEALYNITNAELLEKSAIQSGDPVHVGVCGPGQSTNDAIFVGRVVVDNRVDGVILAIRGREEEFPWADLIELWPLPSIYALSGPQKQGRLSEFNKKVFGVDK